MLKYFFLYLTTLFFIKASVIHEPRGLKNGNIIPYWVDFDAFDSTRQGSEEIINKWQGHLMDFVNLIDLEKVIGVFMKHISNPDVMNFLGFITGPEFKETIVKFEDIEEFKEAVKHLQTKGYDIQPVIDLIHSLLELPFLGIKSAPGASNGVTTLITEIIQALPIQDMKNLFEEKLEQDSDVKELFDTLTSEEFVDIIKRLVRSPKFLEIKQVFEGYGFDFDNLRVLAEDIFGDYLKKITGTV